MEEVQQFKRQLATLGYSKSSVEMLPSCLREFLRFTIKPIDQIESKDITAYYQYLEERPHQRRSGGLSESYINHHIYSLKLYFTWLQENKRLLASPISSLSFPSPKSSPREILTQAEVQSLYAVCENKKERAMLSLFYGCGLRRSEGEKLNLRDIHFRTDLLYVRSGKGNKSRAVPMSEQVREDLKDYIFKERISKENEQSVITNRLGRRTRGNSYHHILRGILERASISKAISLHSLRHSIATHLLEGGLAIEYVRDFLGHKHLESTQLYTRVNQQQLEAL